MASDVPEMRVTKTRQDGGPVDVTCEHCGSEHWPGILIFAQFFATMLCLECASELAMKIMGELDAEGS